MKKVNEIITSKLIGILHLLLGCFMTLTSSYSYFAKCVSNELNSVYPIHHSEVSP